ncbi:helix-turn-helix transcriptional regulator [Microbacterium murale]|uniref:DNA-binding transcriptional regulator YafY n=1 Tax=Microbacterium murale TaxID=1081040 RepID=A0ABU0PDN9_9MICO|nr:WYL domain-containing protein [Microbacterium murale]MDQ0644801.1 putative DNA-binding transcriptional regulator YafY [Microbacterium murale]
MRADRLISALLYLQGQPRVTARELAEELEVSVATARRDLEALSTAGIPVYPQPGRHGGWALLGGARTDLTGLKSGEVQALFLLLGPVVAADPEATSALRKLTAALPSTFRADAEAAAAATVNDRGRWGADSPASVAHLTLLREAIVARRRIRLAYSGRNGQSDRVVEPCGVVEKGENWYLVADTPRGRRTFRVDRIMSLESIDEHFERPSDLNLDEIWRSISDEVEDHRSGEHAIVRVAAEHVDVLRAQFGRHCHLVSEEDGHALVDVAASTPLDIARWLAGWGSQADVVEGDAVRSELVRLGEELVRSHGRTGLGAGIA